MLHMPLRDALAKAVISLMLAVVALSAARAETVEEIQALNREGAQLYGQDKVAEALALVERALKLAETSLGQDHPVTLQSLNNLAVVYSDQDRKAEAEPLYKRAVEARERVLGRDDADTLASVVGLAGLLRSQNRYDEVEPLYAHVLTSKTRTLGKDNPETLAAASDLVRLNTRQGRYTEAEGRGIEVLAARERMLGKEHEDTLSSVNALATVYEGQGRYSEAEELFKRAMDASEHARGPEHSDTLTFANNLAAIYRLEGKYSEAEPLFNRVLNANERLHGAEHPDTLIGYNNLAALYRDQARFNEAEPLYKRALEAQERTLGQDDPDIFISLGNLAGLYQTQGRLSEAEQFSKRALAGYERRLGPDHPFTLMGAHNLASVYDAQGRYSEAEALYKQALAARERMFGAEHPQTILTLSNLGYAFQAQGRSKEAVPLFQKALDARRRILGEDHPQTLGSYNNLGYTYLLLGRLAEAEPLLNACLSGFDRVLGAEHREALNCAGNLALLNIARHDWARASQILRRSAAAVGERTKRGARDAGRQITGKTRSEADQLSPLFTALIKAIYRLPRAGGGPDAALSRETFETAQWAVGSEAAQSLAQMSARSAKGDPELAALVRERQDLVAEWQAADALRTASFGHAPSKRNAETEKRNRARSADIDERVAVIDARLAAAFPDYVGLASPSPLSVEEVQAHLGTDEALVLFLDTREIKPVETSMDVVDEETFIWVVTKTETRWVSSDRGTPAIYRLVRALRCGLDAAELVTEAGVGRCGELLQRMDLDDPSKPLPFDLERAHKLYRALFGQIEDLIKGKHLLIVPSGPLTQLPFQVLVTDPPAKANYKSAAWLARKHALTVLPAVSSLKALRRVAHASAATKPIIGFGNPLLDGPDERYAKRAESARDNQHCHGSGSSQRMAALRSMRGVTPVPTRSGLADVQHIRSQAPLPETADELCAVAGDLQADPGEIRLGSRATEHEVKALSVSGRLADYRVVHFATHGAMAGELNAAAEPGLLLTPPATASAEDDGYLSASEIAGLKLDADWVILSACNTAAGDASGAQALSGLARAFFYAQTRALLVSHWAVNSDATVKLITRAMHEMRFDRSIGRAEALRRAMLALIDTDETIGAHPAYWAPFIVVGEGGR